jgi:glucose 1-dehydrogenase
MQIDLTGKRALVTGAGRGIGRGCALALARSGADVAVNDRTASEDARLVVAEIQGLGRQAWLLPGDVFSRSSCELVAAEAQRAMGQVDILVSNPALSRRADFLDFDPALFEQVIQGTLTGGFHMSQLVTRQMVAAGTRGKIIFIASVHAEVPYVRSAAYNAAKTGLVALAKTIAAELLTHRINVNVVAPGWIDTPGEHETFGGEAIAAAAPALPWGRLGTPADIGQAVVFLASDAADYMTGTTLVVDGGFLLQAALPRSLPADKP